MNIKLKIEKIADYTVPLFGNKRILPYGSLIVTDGETTVTAKIRDEGGRQYITFKKRKYFVRNVGELYIPRYTIIGSIEDAADFLGRCNYKVERQGEYALRVYYKDRPDEFTQVTPCDDSRERYYMIEGRVQNLIDWIEYGRG